MLRVNKDFCLHDSQLPLDNTLLLDMEMPETRVALKTVETKDKLLVETFSYNQRLIGTEQTKRKDLATFRSDILI